MTKKPATPPLRVLHGGRAKTKPKIRAKLKYRVELRYDLDGNLHLFEKESGAPIQLACAIDFLLPIEAIREEEK